MSSSFLTRFSALHERAKMRALSQAERVEYERSRLELGRLLLVAQQAAHAGKTLRAALRATEMWKVELMIGDLATEKTTTLDIAQGGFAVLLGRPLVGGTRVRCKLHVPGPASAPLEADVRVASSRPKAGQRGASSLHRVSFAFEGLSPEAQERLDSAIIDAVLRRLTKLAT